MTIMGGADSANKFRGVVSVIFGCQESLINSSLLARDMKYTSQHCCDKTMDGKMATYAVLRIVKIMVKKFIFVCFRGAIAPITPTWICPCIMGALHTELKQTVLNSWYTKTMGVSRGIKTVICPSLEIGTKNRNLLENLTSAAQLQLDDLFLAMTVWHDNSHCTTAQEPGSLFWCHAVVSLQFTRVRFFASRGRLPNL